MLSLLPKTICHRWKSRHYSRLGQALVVSPKSISPLSAKGRLEGFWYASKMEIHTFSFINFWPNRICNRSWKDQTCVAPVRKPGGTAQQSHEPWKGSTISYDVVVLRSNSIHPSFKYWFRISGADVAKFINTINDNFLILYEFEPSESSLTLIRCGLGPDNFELHTPGSHSVTRGYCYLTPSESETLVECGVGFGAFPALHLTFCTDFCPYIIPAGTEILNHKDTGINFCSDCPVRDFIWVEINEPCKPSVP